MAAALAKLKDTLQVPNGDAAGAKSAGSGAAGAGAGAGDGERRRGQFPLAKGSGGGGSGGGAGGGGGGGTEGVGLMGLLASKKFAGKLANKMYERRRTLARESTTTGMPAAVKLENTYRLEPKTKVSEPSVRAILQSVLHETLDKYAYKPRTAAIVCRKMTEEIQEQTKSLNINRYKLVTTVMLGEKKQQSMMVSSRCAWDEKNDNYATYTFSNAAIFCTATVYAVYSE